MSRNCITLEEGFIIAGYDPPMHTWYAQLYADEDSPDDAPRAVIGYHPSEVAIGKAERPDMRVVGTYPIRDRGTLLGLIEKEFGCSIPPSDLPDDEVEEEVVMLRFVDGPLAERDRSTVGVPVGKVGWPPPERLMVVEVDDALAIVNADVEDAAGGLIMAAATLNADVSPLLYRRVTMSQLDDRVIRDMSHVARGAQYELDEKGAAHADAEGNGDGALPG